MQRISEYLPSLREKTETLSENSQTHLTETQIQLKELTREIVELRQQNSALREQSRRIPELEERIRNLAQGLEHEISRRSHSHAVETGSSVSVEADHDGSLGSLLNEITHLKSLLAGKDKAEHDLKKEIVTLKSTTNSQEFKCKQIISACVGVPLESVESLLDPLLRALQTDDPIDTLDVSQVSRLMGKMKEQEARVIERAA